MVTFLWTIGKPLDGLYFKSKPKTVLELLPTMNIYNILSTLLLSLNKQLKLPKSLLSRWTPWTWCRRTALRTGWRSRGPPWPAGALLTCLELSLKQRYNNHMFFLSYRKKKTCLTIVPHNVKVTCLTGVNIEASFATVNHQCERGIPAINWWLFQWTRLKQCSHLRFLKWFLPVSPDSLFLNKDA